jgi:hypothetical protein
MTNPDNRPAIYRQRAKELADLAATMSGPSRDELLSVSLMWKRMADRAEDDLIKMVAALPKEEAKSV